MKTKFFMVAAMIGLLATACNKENERQEIIQTPITMTATYDCGNAKVNYTESGNSITATWQTGDQIKVVVDGQVSTLTLASGANSSSATFTGTINHTNELTATTPLICYVSDTNYPGAVTVNSNGSYTYTSGAFTGQNGTMADAAKRNLYYGVAQFGDGTNINCNFSVNTSMMKFTVATGLAENTNVTLTYKSAGTTIASATFNVDADGTKTVYMSIPAGKYDGAQTLVCSDGSSNATATLSATQANFGAGQTYSKSFVYLFSSTGAITATNGTIIAGTGGSSTHLLIAAGATVTLSDVKIKRITGDWPGITCLGNATINLYGLDTVIGGPANNPAIYPAHNSEGAEYTLTIQGTGSLYAKYCDGYDGVGIGSTESTVCGNIEIKDGNITAIGSNKNVGIGAGYSGICGNITISGGTVTAECNEHNDFGGAGIGAGHIAICGNIIISGGTVTAIGASSDCPSIGTSSNNSRCGTITITSDVTKIMAKRDSSTPVFIGKYAYGGMCGLVTIDGVTNFSFTTSTTQFEHLNSELSVDGMTWTLTHK